WRQGLAQREGIEPQRHRGTEREGGRSADYADCADEESGGMPTLYSARGCWRGILTQRRRDRRDRESEEMEQAARAPVSFLCALCASAWDFFSSELRVLPAGILTQRRRDRRDRESEEMEQTARAPVSFLCALCASA